jgi:NAD(P)-dependent dehydrogenase (short-subunit alcohol dehydrogenase family)
MASQLSGKVIVVMGGTSGLGLSAVRACVGQGARVVVVGRDAAKADAVASMLGKSVRVVVGDAAVVGTAESAIDIAESAFGGFHGLYHVAGGSGRRRGDGLLHELSDEGWDYTLNLNLRSVFLSNRAAVRRMRERGIAGSILNCGSVLGFSPSSHFFATQAYAAAKAAIIGLTRSAAAQYASEGIRFNVVAPGLVATPMSQRAQGDERILAFVKTKQPLDGGRIGRPEDLDAAVTWLLSDAAGFVTGQVIAVDGGWSVSEGQWG